MDLVLKASENDLVFTRSIELAALPVQGQFDIEHLKAINFRLFQDFPANGFTDIRPGEFRPPVTEAGKDWMKNRGLETNPSRDLFVTYSRMDDVAIARLDKTLQAISPASLAQLKTADFTKQFAELYVELDYLHPFSDGNSRTLRAFTGQLAKECGYDVNWERFSKSEAGRDLLYIARDLSVNALAKPHIQSERTMRRISITQDMLGSMRDLPNLLQDAIRPSRALAFESQEQDDALKAFPELKDAYEAKRVASATLQASHRGHPVQQEAAMVEFTARLQARLNAGEISDFSQSRTPLKSLAPTPGRDKSKPTQERDR